jgi:exonuclease III
MGARLVGLNVRGLRDSQALFALIREANRKRSDVLFLQEVNVRRAQVEQFTKNAADFGFAAYVSSSSSPGERGGTAVLVRKEGPVRVSGVVISDETGDTITSEGPRLSSSSRTPPSLGSERT